MKLKIVGSSSAGNGYLLENEKEALLIECGCKLAKVKQALNFNLKKLSGALITHEHGDHGGQAVYYAREGVKVHASKETLEGVGLAGHHNAVAIKAGMAFFVGSFHVLAFDLVHDVRCFGFLINHKETGRFVFITDTHYSPARFNSLNNLIIEANYSELILSERLENKEIDPAYYHRVKQSHMSLETAIEMALANDLSAVNNIVLIHLSNGNSDERLFARKMQQATNKTVHVADAGMELDFNEYPF